MLLAAWAGGVWRARDGFFGHPWSVFGQGVVAVLAAAAWVTWRRACGEACPGQRWALAVVPVTTAWALVRPLEQQVPVFPYASGGVHGAWTPSAAAWAAVGALACLVLALVLTREGRRWERIAH